MALVTMFVTCFVVHVLALISGCQSGRLHQLSPDFKQVFNSIARAVDGLYRMKHWIPLFTLGGRIIWDPPGQNPGLLTLGRRNFRSCLLRLRRLSFEALNLRVEASVVLRQSVQMMDCLRRFCI